MKLDFVEPSFITEINSKFDENPDLIFDLLGLAESKQKKSEMDTFFESVYNAANGEDKNNDR